MGDCLKSTGKLKTEQRTLPPFETLELYDHINVNYYYAPNYELEVQAGENLIDLVHTEVENGILRIENRNRCNWVRSYKKEITINLKAPSFQNFNYYSSAKVVFQDSMRSDTFRLNLWEASGSIELLLNSTYVELKSNTGPGDITARGECFELVSYMSGNGTLNSQQLQAKKALAITVNTGDILLRVTDELKAEIKGSGDIFYQGQPVIELSDQGKGKLIRIP